MSECGGDGVWVLVCVGWDGGVGVGVCVCGGGWGCGCRCVCVCVGGDVATGYIFFYMHK